MGEEQNTSEETNPVLSAGSSADGRTNELNDSPYESIGETNEPNGSPSESTDETTLSTGRSGSPSIADIITSSSFFSDNDSSGAAQGDSDTDSRGRDREDGNYVAESAACSQPLPWKRKGDISASAICRVDEVMAKVGKMSESELAKLPELVFNSCASALYVARTGKLPPKDFKYTDSEAHWEQEKKKACEDSRSSLQEKQLQNHVHLENFTAAEDAAYSEEMTARETRNTNASESHGAENVEKKPSEDSEVKTAQLTNNNNASESHGADNGEKKASEYSEVKTAQQTRNNNASKSHGAQNGESNASEDSEVMTAQQTSNNNASE